MKSLQELEKSVSCETIKKLKLYEQLLKKWQKAINLVGKNTVEDAWNRHILDSLQVIKYLPKNENLSIVDLGSGAGFPPLVISMSGYNNVSAIESDERKCFFMQEVAKQTNTKINIINERIEKVEKMQADVITSRALAKIDELLIFSKDLSNEDTIYLFLKGKTAQKEVEKARESFDFEAETFKSLTSSEANIIKITNLKEKK
jgi:16S rRNA (guanine527-N7)-methyltransferase